MYNFKAINIVLQESSHELFLTVKLFINTIKYHKIKETFSCYWTGFK